jgi:hypothetical protein
MTQNLVSLNVSDARLTELLAAMVVLETGLDWISLAPGQRRKLPKMGAMSEPFCRQTLNLMEQNPDLVSGSFGLAGGQAKLASLDQLRPFFLRFQRMGEKISDTEFALGSDVMSVALKGYGALKSDGSGQGLDGARRTLATRFARSSRTPSEESSAEPVVTVA